LRLCACLPSRQGEKKRLTLSMPIPVIAIFDIGKTNKKLLLFNEQYKVVFEQSVQFAETIDEDGDPCEDINRLTEWVKEYLYIISASDEFDVRALNVSAYGASLIHLDEEGDLLTPLYNYLKVYPEDLKNKFYARYGGEELVSLETASPVLGSLNSGMQLYRLKYQRPDVFNRIKYSLHLPQYLAWLITGKSYSDITSIGCHTGLWDFTRNNYHEWVFRERIDEKLAPFFQSDKASLLTLNHKEVIAGIGLHDSSAALIPYLSTFHEPFLLLSTGTWCISLNPFNDTPLTRDELRKDCLCYMDYKGRAIKASRLFSGNEHEKQIRLLAEHYLVQLEYYKKVVYNRNTLLKLKEQSEYVLHQEAPYEDLASFSQRDYSLYKTYEEAYHQLILDLVSQQVISTGLVMNNKTRRIFVDGGFSKNPVFMNILAAAFPQLEVYAASVAQATALGAALAIHHHWNRKPLPENLIELEYYPVG
jgi:sugar (pentulose or hexulose) kinase